jgi:hypothetical protein
MVQAAVAEVVGRHSYEPLPKKLKEWHSHYEAGYFDFVARLSSEDSDGNDVLLALLKFRIFRKAFLSGLAGFTDRPGMVTSLSEGPLCLALAEEASEKLLSAFPGHGAPIERGLLAPAALLPFIKLHEDPFSEILGQTLKLAPERSLVMVRSGSGRELPTLMHERLHASVRNLPGVFEEGFCRYALQSRGLDEDELLLLPGRDRDTIRWNFAPIYYPNLLVAMLSQGVGERKTERSFFGEDAGALRLMARLSGKEAGELERIFRKGLHAEAASVVMKLRDALRGYLDRGLAMALDAVGEAFAAR